MKTGVFKIEDLLIGRYCIVEEENPNYGYERNTKDIICTIDSKNTTQTIITNTRNYIKLSGYVWVDKMPQGKDNRDNLYDSNSNDILLDGIKVKLVDNFGNTIKETTTENGGKYLFEDVLVDKVKQKEYHIEFEYNGLQYASVKKELQSENGSKAVENTETRGNFNKNFYSVKANTSSSSITKDRDENSGYTIDYDMEQEKDNHKYISKFIDNGQFNIVADTVKSGYEIKYVPGQEEIKNINLGLYEREQADISIAKDIYNVEISINGKTHEYKYNSRFEKDITPGQDDFDNLGISYKEKFTGTYIRPIYKSDYTYKSEDASKNLKVYVTYKIRMINETTSLTEKVNTIIDNYDSNYKLIAAGTELNKNDLQIDYKQENRGNKFNSAKINVNKQINYTGTNYEDVYIKFELNEAAIDNIVDKGENLDNYVEIYSYSTLQYGQIYAAIDKDSNPGNMTGDRLSKIANTSDYKERKKLMEDDEDSAPGLKLVWAQNRQLSGTVFLDSTDGKLYTGEVREGDGKYDESKEGGIEGVTVKLIETTTREVYTATTDDSGDFTISGYVPGDYKLVYTWGDKTYTVQNYKGTVYKESSRANDTNWYANNTETRYSDAMDDYELRQEIDNENSTITTMDSTTPVMDIGVDTVGNGSSWIICKDEENRLNGEPVETGYTIKNVDFGIVERARQQIDIDKTISNIKLTLANGQVIIDAKVNNGKLEGVKQNVNYEPASQNNNPKNGYAMIQLDNELIQGANLEVTYKISVKNNSELDYASEDFYKYGKDYYKQGEEYNLPKEYLIKLKPTEVYDYLDNNAQFMNAFTLEENNEEKQEITEIKTKAEYDEKCGGETKAEKYYSSTVRKDENGNIYESWEEVKTEYQIFFEEWKESSSSETKLKNKNIISLKSLISEYTPKEEKNLYIKTSKILSNQDEIEINNDSEIIDVEKSIKSGREIIAETSLLIDRGERVTVTPNTGENKEYLPYIMLAISSLIILSSGIILIKKKIIK